MDKNTNDVIFNDILMDIEREKIDILYKQDIQEKKLKTKNSLTNKVKNFIHSFIN